MMPIISVPAFPDVPIVLGVPNVLRNPVTSVTQALYGGIAGLPVSLSSQLTQVGSNQGLFIQQDGPTAIQPLSQTWGIYTSAGVKLVTPDTFVSVEIRAGQSRIPTFPQEQGGFQSYNKVQIPSEIRVQMSYRGSEEGDRAHFLDTLDAASKSIDLYSVATPDEIYFDMSILRYDYKRERTNGAEILHVDIFFEEVRITAESVFSNTEQPSGASPVSGATVQAAVIPPQANAPQTPVAAQISMDAAVTQGAVFATKEQMAIFANAFH
jgi:hypothetical protein